MAILSDPARAAAMALFIGELNNANPRESIATLKADLRAAINAADQWIDDNAASYNSALPAAARTTLTAKQKARILVHVIRKRYEAT